MKKRLILISMFFLLFLSSCNIEDILENPTKEKETEGHICVFDQQVVSSRYLLSEATCTTPAKYYYSCLCGKKGIMSFKNGELGLHDWDDGVFKEGPIYDLESGKYYNKFVYTCVLCSAEKYSNVVIGDSEDSTPTPTPIPTPTPTPNPEEQIHSILISNNILNGSVVIEKVTAESGEEILFEIIPSEGYELDKIYLNDIEVEKPIFIMPNDDVVIYVTFKEKEKECNHSYENNVCIYCGKEKPNSYLNELFGDDIDIYTNEEKNPYNVDLNKYGSDITAYFYEPNVSILTDPYANVNKTEFYKNYTPAQTYEDAYFRSKHYLISGDISKQSHLPIEGKIMDGENAIKLVTGTYILKPNGDYLAYIPNVFNDDYYIIFYGAGYTSLNEVAAYLLAFGQTPANTISNKGSSGQKNAINLWGEYGRVNDSWFSGDTSKYPYEPELPKIMGANKITYNEMDFGTIGGYINSNSNGTYYNQKLYNNGSSISRGAARMVYVSDPNVKSIDERYVFYTYNHYNDFQEYLNYHNGWGYRFGNQTAGNEYCGDKDDYYALNCIPPTKYPDVLLKKYSEVK